MTETVGRVAVRYANALGSFRAPWAHNNSVTLGLGLAIEISRRRVRLRELPDFVLERILDKPIGGSPM